MTEASPLFDQRRGATIPADYVVSQEWDDYTDQDHATWRTLFVQQCALLDGRVVDEYFDGLQTLGIRADSIPEFEAMNRVLMNATGWRVVAVPGLVPSEVFFAHLAERRFPAGYWIRAPKQLDYIEEPDVFHDVFGHVPLLMQPRYADYMAAYGRAGLAMTGRPELANLGRLYWYTVEFGLMQTLTGLRIFGAGIISSKSESLYALESERPARLRFDCERAMRTDVHIDEMQQVYFVLADYDELPELKTEGLAAHVAAARALPEIAPGEMVEGDEIVAIDRAVPRRRHS